MKGKGVTGLSLAVGLAAALLGMAATGCTRSFESTAEVSLSAGDLIYLRDDRSGLCFAVLAVQNPAGTSIVDTTMARVPCESLSGVEVR